MNKFKFTISKPRSIDIDHTDLSKSEQLMTAVPSYKLCIGCGACTATCTAGQLTNFNIRRIHTMFTRGQYEELDKQLQSCMLCGKCILVCPRGVNTRALIINMRKILNNE